VIETPRMRVHLYHDVRMAEVTDFQRQRHQILREKPRPLGRGGIARRR
jgi:uncharacterized protein YqiB (DUF1249 family)